MALAIVDITAVRGWLEEHRGNLAPEAFARFAAAVLAAPAAVPA